MARILSGIQPSGQLHLGNYAGAIRQFLDLQTAHEIYVFVATYHAQTTTWGDELKALTRQAVIDYLAYGLDPERAHIYLQQDLPEVTELSWILSTCCPTHLMDKAVSYKDKLAKGIRATVGLYGYPVLQAADILIVDADLVPVGKDQVQHIEITRDLALAFNHRCGTDVLKLPDHRLQQAGAILPGIDGEKMSKSYGNTIDPFAPEKQLRKRVMAIKTDSKELDEAKDPESCPVFAIFRAIAGTEDVRTVDLAAKYRAGGFGYGHAKQALFELLVDHFAAARQRRVSLQDDPAFIDAVLARGATRAREAAAVVMDRVRQASGLR